MMHFSRLIARRRLAILAVAATPLVTGSILAQNSNQDIASREIARRMARIEDARQAMARGDELYAKGDRESALNQYKAAKETFDALPNAPFIQDWRDLANLKYADCAAQVARDKAVVGDYPRAHELIIEADRAVPGHKAAKILADHLADPDRWPPALTPQHVANVAKVKELLLLANSSLEIGNYDDATTEFQDVLRIDPYNTAARRGMERAEQKRSEYFDAARDNRRAEMLRMVDEAWENKPPVRGLTIAGPTGGGPEPTVYLTRKMQQIIFPSVQFAGASIDEAIQFLRVKSQDLDVFESDPTKKGVNLILKAGDAPPSAQISLDLKDVPMAEALRYVTELAGMKYKVEPFAVIVVPASETTNQTYTRTFRVPPDFLASGSPSGGAAAAPAASADPFAQTGGGSTGGTTLSVRPTAKDILVGQGIPFPDGTSAVFNAATSQLIVTNTQPNLDLVEMYVDSLNRQGPKQIYITSKFVEVSQKNTDELGFDWLLGSFGTNADNVFLGGGTTGNSSVTATYPGAIQTLVTGGALSPVSRGLRSGSGAISGDSIDSLFNPSAPGADTVAPGVLSVAGIFTDPQFAVIIRALAQRKGVDLMSAPSVTTKGGQRATVQVVRQFIYPTEFDPPQIPTNVGGGLGGGVSSVPVTPTTPTAFETRDVGVTMEVDPVVGADGFTIDLNLAPEVVEFDGFINYGSPIYQVDTGIVGGALGGRIELTPNVINQPVFSTRKVQTAVTVWDGQTVALGGLIREDVQDVEDKIPVLGDVPFFGRFFKSTAEDHFKRNLMIFVTARLIDPAGQPLNPLNSGTAGATATEVGGGPAPSPILPPVAPGGGGGGGGE